MSDKIVVTRDRAPDVSRELRMIGPAQTRCYSSPVMNEEQIRQQQLPQEQREATSASTPRSG